MAQPRICVPSSYVDVKVKVQNENGNLKDEKVQNEKDRKWRNIMGLSVMAETKFSNTILTYTEIVVVRHGETTCNAEGKLQGQLNVGLSDIGKVQALSVANRLSKETKVSAIYTSDLKRALETAERIATVCGVQKVLQDKFLRERHLGDLQGLKLERAAELKPEAYKALLSHSRDQEIPGGGESLNQVYMRCIAAVEKIGVENQGQRVVVVTHGGVINALQKRVLSMGKEYGPAENASVSIFLLSSKGQWSIVLWNDVGHLDNGEAAPGLEF